MTSPWSGHPVVVRNAAFAGAKLVGVGPGVAQWVPDTGGVGADTGALPSGRYGWYGDGGTGTAAPGDGLTSWTSLLDDGGHHTFTAPSSGSTTGPTLIAGTDAGAPNGKRFVRFDGATNMSMSTGEDLAAPYTIVVQNYATSTADGDSFSGPTLLNWGSPGNLHNWRLKKSGTARMDNPVGPDYIYRNGLLASAPAADTNSVDLFPLNGWQVWERVNPDLTNNHGTFSMDYPDADGTGKYWDGDVAFILVVDHIPTTAERHDLLLYLVNYYGLVGVVLP